MGILGVIPEEVRGTKSRVVVLGREEMLVEQHRGLIAYEREEIRFRVREGEVKVFGRDLTIAAFGAYDAKVTGKIQGVTLAEDVP